ncbi:MetQ/NlpA family ABC transporter substrate-binding protein [Desulfitobacterium sp. Sab5]|uniref:MetQ/NlpA family ABC transporter substrate-binding protein n=1 Tax=Desulfitobacterium nosdiversum TaxID=3375356 RepID=UPI003CFBBFD4
MKKLKFVALTLALVVGITSIVGCSSSKTGSTAANSSSTSTKTVKIGVVGENNETWNPVIQSLAAEGVKIELVKFADYTLPNQALQDGEIDLNAFQHYAFLKKAIQDKNYQLTAIGETIIAPLGLYSKKIKNVNELKNGDQIAIPNDPSNGGRALKLLESAGLIKIKPEVGYLPTVKDITENKLNLKFHEVEAAQTAGLLPDVAAAVINGGHAIDAHLNPQSDAIFLESVNSGSDNPYINVIVARTVDKDNEIYKKIVKAYRTPAVADVIKTTYKGAYLPTWK